MRPLGIVSDPEEEEEMWPMKARSVVFASEFIQSDNSATFPVPPINQPHTSIEETEEEHVFPELPRELQLKIFKEQILYKAFFREVHEFKEWVDSLPPRESLPDDLANRIYGSDGFVALVNTSLQYIDNINNYEGSWGARRRSMTRRILMLRSKKQQVVELLL